MSDLASPVSGARPANRRPPQTWLAAVRPPRTARTSPPRRATFR